MISKKIVELLKNREFISVATCDFAGRPNAAPKFILKFESNFIYLIDYTIGKTWENLKINPRVSLSLMDTDNLTGYQINGPVQIIESGSDYKKILEELREREIHLSVERVIKGIHTQKRHEVFEVVMPQKFVIFKVKIEDLAQIGPRGDLKREKL
jgi:predicted pyridoxine 5'-phosphate oxidase superfamily flavin-nucleotide-binding protein